MSDKLLIALLERFSIRELRLFVDIMNLEVDDYITDDKHFEIQNYGGEEGQTISFSDFASIISKFIH